MFLFRSGAFAQVQRKAFLSSLSPSRFLRNYMLEIFTLNASRLQEMSEDLVQKDVDQLHVHEGEHQQFFYAPCFSYTFGRRFFKFMTKDLCEAKKQDMEVLLGKLKEYYELYAFMDYMNKMFLFSMNVMLKCNTNYNLPSKLWRYSAASEPRAMIPDLILLFEAFYRVYDEASPVWKKKLEKELGKQMAYIFDIFEGNDKRLIIDHVPQLQQFEMEKGLYFK